MLNAASRVGEASTTVLYTIGEETEEDKETQVTDASSERCKLAKKSFLYRKLNYCYDNFYNVFFGKNKDFGDDFDRDPKMIHDDGDEVKPTVMVGGGRKVGGDDDGIYEDIDISRQWGLDVIQEESDSDYYRSLDYCNALLKSRKSVTIDDINQIKNSRSDVDKVGDVNLESIVEDCEIYLDKKFDNRSAGQPSVNNISISKDDKVNNDYEAIGDYIDNPKLYPKTISDKIYNFKKDFSNHDYVNINYDRPKQYSDIDFERRYKNDLLRQKFFLSNNIDKNDINDRFNRYKGKNIECHSIRNDVTKSGRDAEVSGSLNMKLFDIDKYNRVLTTKERFMETAVASFTKHELSKMRNDNFENFIKRSEKYYTSEMKDVNCDVSLNNQKPGKTEIRIFYNPSFRAVRGNMKGFCQFCRRRCPRSEVKCCQNCICLELEWEGFWRDNWLNVFSFLSIILVCIILLFQWILGRCDDEASQAGKCDL